MKFSEIINKIDKKQIVDFFKKDAHILLENKYQAEYYEVLDDIVDCQVNKQGQLKMVFLSDDNEHSIKITLKAFDYEVKKMDITSSGKEIISNYEDEQSHFEGRKKYIKFVAEKIKELTSKEVAKKYYEKAEARVLREIETICEQNCR